MQQQVRTLLLHALPPTPSLEMPETAPKPVAPAPRTPRLGHYLQTLGLISEEQLAHALKEQEWSTKSGVPVALGDMLVAQGLLTPRDLVMALMFQQLDKLQESSGTKAIRLGELLIRSGVISASQLASALNLQMQRRQAGEQVLLGQILIAQGALTPESLATALRDQASTREASAQHKPDASPAVSP
jgi:hypothetical protein